MTFSSRSWVLRMTDRFLVEAGNDDGAERVRGHKRDGRLQQQGDGASLSPGGLLPWVSLIRLEDLSRGALARRHPNRP